MVTKAAHTVLPKIPSTYSLPWIENISACERQEVRFIIILYSPKSNEEPGRVALSNWVTAIGSRLINQTCYLPYTSSFVSLVWGCLRFSLACHAQLHLLSYDWTIAVGGQRTVNCICCFSLQSVSPQIEAATLILLMGRWVSVSQAA